MHGFGKVSEHCRIDCISFRKLAQGLGKVACLPRIDYRYGNCRWFLVSVNRWPGRQTRTHATAFPQPPRARIAQAYPYTPPQRAARRAVLSCWTPERAPPKALQSAAKLGTQL